MEMRVIVVVVNVEISVEMVMLRLINVVFLLELMFLNIFLM